MRSRNQRIAPAPTRMVHVPPRAVEQRRGLMRSLAETQNGAISSNGRFPFGQVLIRPEGSVRSWGEEEEVSPLFFIAAAAAAATIFSTAASAARFFSGSGTRGR